MKPGLTTIIAGILGLIWAPLAYLNNTSTSSYYLPLIFLFLMVFIIGLFELREYYNKSLYLMAITVILAVMWIMSFIQPLSPSTDKTIYYIVTGLLTLFIILVVVVQLREWNKFQKELEPYDKALAINPNNTTALNNKGVELTGQKRYKKAIEYFNKTIEIEPQDAAAWHNKGFVLKKLKKRGEAKKYHNKALELDPKFELAKKAGKIILEN